MEAEKGPSIIAKWTKAKFATRNLHGGIQYPFQMATLCNDMQHHQIMVAALQETYTQQEDFVYMSDDEETHILSMGKDPQGHHYGQGFYLSKEARSHLADFKRVSNRLSFIRLYASYTEEGKKNIITFINVYAPTGMITRARREETEEFYHQLFKPTICRTEKRFHIGVCNGRF